MISSNLGNLEQGYSMEISSGAEFTMIHTD